MIHTGRFSLKLKEFGVMEDSFCLSIRDQLLHVLHFQRSQVASLRRLKELIQKLQQDLGVYVHAGGVLPHRSAMRTLVLRLRCSIKVYYADGYSVLYPYQFRMDEPVIQLFAQNGIFASIHEVNHINSDCIPIN